ncbi:ABC transporter permease [Xanthobacteraceae bacterium Astr-EGSB]|uniref:ABC transporter permease n=1 Tax=Astrobacterium formosum TaxID=3069710 RepID=UPI0027B1DBEB|nr:ABC transporter permease [Xanthobacteraceae bacterium Astr-EGSB]
MTVRRFNILLALPLGAIVAAFFLLPMGILFLQSFVTRQDTSTYFAILTTPRYLSSLLATLALAIVTTLLTLALSTTVGLLLARQRFPGRSVLIALMTFPLAFPGVVVGFMVILLAGRQGLVGEITRMVTGDKIVFAYSMTGLLVGYLYFSIPRVLLTVMAAAEKLDPALEDAARSLGASPVHVLADVVLPALKPAFIASGAICFATAMGAFGTAFTLATKIDVLPMVIYTEFTLNANVAMAAALSIFLGAITWVALTLARTFGGTGVAAAG